METVQILLGTIIFLLVLLAMLIYMLIKEAKSIVAKNQIITDKIDEFILVKNAGDQQMKSFFEKVLEENQNLHKTLKDVIDFEKELSDNYNG